ncbi:MAG: hypothetical protein KME38_04155 [Spirirestis rafaelensis WJT71-NPBG6]|jgi:hypothetical protein|nr:hypothetical protein [Spirirestis rafaelensis WJT71-NPBG6]
MATSREIYLRLCAFQAASTTPTNVIGSARTRNRLRWSNLASYQVRIISYDSHTLHPTPRIPGPQAVRGDKAQLWRGGVLRGRVSNQADMISPLAEAIAIFIAGPANGAISIRATKR